MTCWASRSSCTPPSLRLRASWAGLPTGMEELVNVDKIIRPAYQSIMQTREYVPLEER